MAQSPEKRRYDRWTAKLRTAAHAFVVNGKDVSILERELENAALGFSSAAIDFLRSNRREPQVTAAPTGRRRAGRREP